MFKLAVNLRPLCQGNLRAVLRSPNRPRAGKRRLDASAQRFPALLFVASLGILAGCPIVTPVALRQSTSPAASEPRSRDALVNRIDAVLEQNLEQRQLSTDVHGAWQILHGVLAYGRDFEIQAPAGRVVAVDYLSRGGTVNGFELRSGDRFADARADSAAGDEPLQTRGIRTELDPNSKLGQGHRDQWLAYMAPCKLSPDEVIQTLDGPRRVALWVRQIEWDVPLNFEREYSWTLMSLLPYRKTSHRWTARDGQDYSIESLLGSELDQLSPDSACGGSHRLVAISMALNQRKTEAGEISGVWADAQFVVDQALNQALEFQNQDWSFSSSYFERPGWSLDLATAIGTTGHTLEFIAVAGSDRLIADQAVNDAAAKLCELLEQTARVDLECGALYHALSGLQIYRRRLAAIASS